jgi:hypothetical protein
MLREEDRTAQAILERLSDLENHSDEEIVPYREFNVDGKLYYFTPGGFLYRKDPGTGEIGGFFCGYLTDEGLALQDRRRIAGASPHQPTGPGYP